MSTNNDVFKVLVSKGNAVVLAPGSTVDALSPGQIGIFDVNTDLSIDGTAPVKNFFIAVGLDKDGDTVLDDINVSAGQLIQARNIKNYSFRPHTAGRPQIMELTGFAAKCDTDYTLRIEFRNQEIYKRQGYNQFSKPYTVRTSCCEGCEDCPSGSCQELGNLIVDEINRDTDGLAIASLFVNQGSITITGEPTADGNITVTANGEAIVVAILNADDEAGVATKIAAAFASSTVNLAVADGDTVTFTSLGNSVSNPTGTVLFADTGTTGATATVVNFASVVVTSEELALLEGVCPGVRITSVPLAINNYCNINLKYHNPRQTIMVPSLISGFECNGSIITTQDAANEEGSYYDIKQKEYHAGAWDGNPGPYRLSEATGTAYDITYYAEANEEYDQFALTYDQFSVSGWQEHFNNLATIIAVPATSTVTRNSLVTILDRIAALVGLHALADDVALANVNPAVVETTSDIDDPLKDGIA
jgi:hypothetical protein